MSFDEVLGLLARLDDGERRGVLKALREDHGVGIHAIERDWNTTAEVILEAIHASPDLTQRGVRGVVAEAIFRTVVVPERFAGWNLIDFFGDEPYDVLVEDQAGRVSIQVKNQRRELQQPKVYKALGKACGSTVYVVETQRTRTGKATDADGEETKTRPYRFGEFDVLAVCMQPSTGEWTDFYYCPSHLLLPHPKNPANLKTLQPLYTNETNGWTRDFNVAAQAFREHQAERQ